jgi:hypothetical protein
MAKFLWKSEREGLTLKTGAYVNRQACSGLALARD